MNEVVKEVPFFQDLAVMMAVVGLVSVVFSRLRWPKVIGYLFAGILMSEHTWGGSFLVHFKAINDIGQLGIVFLMFTLGLEFSVDSMKKVRHVAVPTAIFDMVVMIWLGYVVGTRFLGWGSVPSLFLGAAICDSATTLLAKTIEEMKWSERPFVRFIFGSTICEDILCVGVIALITGVAQGNMNVRAVGESLGGLLLFFVGVFVFGLVLVPRFLNRVAAMKDDEALLLALLGGCFFVSYVADSFNFSLAMGAFLVGILGASSDVRARLHELASPLRNMFAAIFFVTIGLLVDPMACLAEWKAILGLTLLVVLGKGFNCFFMSILTGQSVKDSVQTGFGLAQIGEFAFMVALMYTNLTHDSSSPMYQIVVAVSLLTTLLNPMMLRLSDRVGDWCEDHLPMRLRGWHSAYNDWLARFRSAAVPSRLSRHLRSRVIWIAVIGALNLCVSCTMNILCKLDYSSFSASFNNIKVKGLVFCILVNLFCFSMLAPMYGLARSMGQDVAAVLTRARQPKKWKTAVQRVVVWFCLAAVMGAAFLEILMLNSLWKISGWAQLVMWVVMGVVAVLGWKRFRRAGKAAGYRFGEAISAEKRRARKGRSSERDRAISLSVPSDFYASIEVGDGSAAVGETIRSLDIRAKTGASVVAVERGGNRFRNPGPTWEFAPGDIVMSIGEPDHISALRQLLSTRPSAGAVF